MGRVVPANTFRGVVRARSLIEERYDAPLTVEDLARASGLSRFHFIRAFASVYDVTPHQYLVGVRLARAKTLLRGSASVTEACFEVGFSSLGSFSALFARRVGRSPRDFQRDARRLFAVPAGVRPVFIPYCMLRRYLGAIELQDLEGLRHRIEQPCPPHLFSGMDAELSEPVDALRRRRQHLADPVGRDRGVGRRWVLRQALASPPGEVGHEDVFTQVELGLEQKHPPAGSATATVEGLAKLAAQVQAGPRVRQPRPRRGDQVAVDDLADQVFRQREEVLVRRTLLALDRGHGRHSTSRGTDNTWTQ